MSAAREQGRRVEAVAIGASAGGIEALTLLLPAIPQGCDVAVFVVVHLPRDRPSLLGELFVSRCALAVRAVEDKLPVERGSIYFAPPDYHLMIDVGPALALSVDDPVRYSRPSIDVLLESAAEHYRERLLGLLLTGANDDGARGLATIARLGGITVVQDPQEAVAPALPQAGIDSGGAQHVLPITRIRELLARLPAAPNS